MKGLLLSFYDSMNKKHETSCWRVYGLGMYLKWWIRCLDHCCCCLIGPGVDNRDSHRRLKLHYYKQVSKKGYCHSSYHNQTINRTISWTIKPFQLPCKLLSHNTNLCRTESRLESWQLNEWSCFVSYDTKLCKANRHLLKGKPHKYHRNHWNVIGQLTLESSARQQQVRCIWITSQLSANFSRVLIR